MNRTERWQVGLALVLLLVALLLGVLAAIAYLFPSSAAMLPFRQLRPMHVSAALFWILSGASAGVAHYLRETRGEKRSTMLFTGFTVTWTLTIISIFITYGLGEFGGREYWEFPPWLCAPLLVAWLFFMADHFHDRLRRPKEAPLYLWMWSTGVLFFLITFLEQNLWQVPWFRENFLREITVQWKSNGAMVGAWNQMIYGTALYLMVKLTGDGGMARGWKPFAFWFLGLSNLMFNWGHHLYNAPTAGWIRHVAYGISMAEWVLLINIIRGFKAKMDERRRYDHLLTYRFLLASEAWVFLNLFLALLMSIPAINRYTHGTHITVAHAMGATIGINTMILLASLSYMLRLDNGGAVVRQRITRGLWIGMASLLVFWGVLIIAGVMKGYRSVAMGMVDHAQVMAPVNDVLMVFLLAGVGLLGGLGLIAIELLRVLSKSRTASV